MNAASAMGTVWTVIAVGLAIVSAAGLVVLGIRRCYWSVVRTGGWAWRMSGFLLGTGSLALAVAVLGLWLSDLATKVGVSLWAIVAAAALALWAWCMWTDVAPPGELIPGRYTTTPHRPGWMAGVWAVVASWGLLWWVAVPPSGPPYRSSDLTLAAFLDVSAVVLLGGGVVIGWAQASVRRSWPATRRTRVHGPSWAAGPRPWGPGRKRAPGTDRPVRWPLVRMMAGLALLVVGGALGCVLVAAGAWWAASLTAVCTLIGAVGFAPSVAVAARRRDPRGRDPRRREPETETGGPRPTALG